MVDTIRPNALGQYRHVPIIRFIYDTDQVSPRFTQTTHIHRARYAWNTLRSPFCTYRLVVLARLVDLAALFNLGCLSIQVGIVAQIALVGIVSLASPVGPVVLIILVSQGFLSILIPVRLVRPPILFSLVSLGSLVILY